LHPNWRVIKASRRGNGTQGALQWEMAGVSLTRDNCGKDASDRWAQGVKPL